MRSFDCERSRFRCQAQRSQKDEATRFHRIAQEETHTLVCEERHAIAVRRIDEVHFNRCCGIAKPRQLRSKPIMENDK